MTFTSKIDVSYISGVGDDRMVAAAAMVSTGRDPGEELSEEKTRGLIRKLVSQKHDTPFEHGYMCHFVDGPIFMWREHHRHRIGWSYNEESGRYSTLRDKFYVPDSSRKLIPVKLSVCPDCHGSLVKTVVTGRVQCETCKAYHTVHHSMAPCFTEGTPEQYDELVKSIKVSCVSAYINYAEMIEKGYAKEVARVVLPVATFSRCWTSCNPEV